MSMCLALKLITLHYELQKVDDNFVPSNHFHQNICLSFGPINAIFVILTCEILVTKQTLLVNQKLYTT